MPGSDLLSHGETPHYHRRWTFSLLSSEWDQLVPGEYEPTCLLAQRYAHSQRNTLPPADATDVRLRPARVQAIMGTAVEMQEIAKHLRAVGVEVEPIGNPPQPVQAIGVMRIRGWPAQLNGREVAAGDDSADRLVG